MNSVLRKICRVVLLAQAFESAPPGQELPDKPQPGPPVIKPHLFQLFPRKETWRSQWIREQGKKVDKVLRPRESRQYWLKHNS